MLTLKADNRDLLTSAKYSYLSTNYVSGVSSFVIINSDIFTENDYILLGLFGSKTTEIVKIKSINTSTNIITLPSMVNATTQWDVTNTSGNTYRYTWDTTGTDPDVDGNLDVGSRITTAGFAAANNGTFIVTLVAANYFEIVNASGSAESNRVAATVTVITKFAHSESTKVSVLKYNQVKFYQTAAATFSASENPLNGYIPLQVDDLYTKYYDTTNTTGYGWFIFYNSTTLKATQNSNAIPYAGFAVNSVKSILDNFFSTLSNNELKLVSNDDAFTWLDEAYAIAINELNLINSEYQVSGSTSVAVTSGTSEYALETYLPAFGGIISVYNGTDNESVSPIDIKDVSDWDSDSGNTVKYYIRGSYIGFSPQPSTSVTYTVRYKKITTVLTSYYDTVSIPNNNFYILKDFMLSRAAPKLGRGDGSVEYARFMDGIGRMKVTSHKRDDSSDSWGIDSTANV